MYPAKNRSLQGCFGRFDALFSMIFDNDTDVFGHIIRCQQCYEFLSDFLKQSNYKSFPQVNNVLQTKNQGLLSTKKQVPTFLSQQKGWIKTDSG